MASLGCLMSTIDDLLASHRKVSLRIVFPDILLDQFKLDVYHLDKPIEDEVIVKVKLGVQVVLLLDVVEFLSSILQVRKLTL